MTGKRVLVVEDQELVRLVLVDLLRDEGFHVVEASTGDAAASLIDGPGGFDLVVTDIQMPGKLDGIAVGRHARRRHADIPVIYVTGRPESMAGVGRLGSRDAFMRKPYGLQDMVAVVSRLLAA